MKNIPKKIYLQIGGCAPHPDEDFNDLRMSGSITWNDEKLYKDDIEYSLVDDTFTRDEVIDIILSSFKDQIDPEVADAIIKSWERRQNENVVVSRSRSRKRI